MRGRGVAGDSMFAANVVVICKLCGSWLFVEMAKMLYLKAGKTKRKTEIILVIKKRSRKMPGSLFFFFFFLQFTFRG